MTTDARPMVTQTEAAQMIGVSKQRVHQLARDGRLPEPERIGRSVRWPVWQIEEFIAGRACS